MPNVADANELDPHIRLKPVAAAGLRYLAPAEAPLRLDGFAWYGRDRRYERFPADGLPAELNGRPWAESGVALLSTHTAGGMVSFRTDSSRIVIRAELASGTLMDHMPQTGSNGFDVYCGNPDRLRFVGVTRFALHAVEFIAEPVGEMTRSMREVRIHFPLYDGVKSLFIGVDADAAVAAPTPWSDPRPVVVYGTSITQGGCASRPGMCYTNILSRKLNRPFLNFGFSGNGRGEPEVAELFTRVESPALFLLDYEPNTDRVEHFVRTLPGILDAIRRRHPETPVLLLSSPPYGREAVPTTDPERRGRRRGYWEAAYAEIARRNAAGDRRIDFLNGGTLFGADWDECTVDGVHPTDLGFSRMAERLEPELRRLLVCE